MEPEKCEELIQDITLAFNGVSQNVPIYKFKRQVLALWPDLGQEMENCKNSSDVYNVLKCQTDWSSHSSVCNLNTCFKLLASSENNIDLSVVIEKIQAVEEELHQIELGNATSDDETFRVAVKLFSSVSPPEKACGSDNRSKLENALLPVKQTSSKNNSFSLDLHMQINAKEASVGGYDLQLQCNERHGDLICPECTFLLKEAVQTPNGIRMCRSCFEEIARTPECTSCKTGICVTDESGKPTSFPDRAVRREVQQAKVACKNSDSGCEWNGPLNVFLKEHMEECEFNPVPCPHQKRGCKQFLRMSNVGVHTQQECQYRIVSCEYCGDTILLKDLEEHHASCSRCLIKCSLCSERIAREELNDHQNTKCTKVLCSCGDVLNNDASATDSVANHLNSPAVILSHILQLMLIFKPMCNAVAEIQCRLLALDGTVNDPKPQNVSHFHADVRFQNIPGTDHYFQINLRIQELQAKLEQQAQQIEELNSLISDTHTIESVERKFEALDEQVHALKAQVSELEKQLHELAVHNGFFTWRIHNVSQRRRDAISERVTSIHSPPFYTSPNGYKVCMQAYLNGEGIGHESHISLFFVLMKGQYDALLKWPFDHKFSLMLIDQNHRNHITKTLKPNPTSSSFHRPVSDMNIASGCPRFAKVAVLQDGSGYVKDDTIFFECKVHTANT